MFFILSKTISVIVMPIFWLMASFVYALWVRNPKRKQKALVFTFGLFLVLTNTFTVNSLLLLWEIPPTPLSDVKQDYAVGIVLTGITRNLKSPNDRVYLDAGADRIMHALWLYRQGKIKKILITGGTIDISGKVHTSEARLLAKILADAYVPAQDIILDEEAKNTRENALNAKKIIDRQFPQQKYLLITSAFHLRRAWGCFRQVGLAVSPFSAGFHTKDWDRTNLADFVPSEKALHLWYILVHEVVGYMVYWAMGYVR
ncbi:MAG: YdcF family protein [Microscillaceae bacterium]|jgi:uncharacterized SAM-binding protein YcdF (DUF218 family)|nr:YdcF family protein [Microscillaceae bacterium]